ncbi:protein MOR1-like [Salvia splendens]|uniref:protein MOR1-like n=1 Tax=Salvia splendens TaxID=180675 RepID=UPI001C25331F|nr:protein MOR1-like [Salvia splendens]
MSLEEIWRRLGSLIDSETITQLKSVVWKERLEGDDIWIYVRKLRGLIQLNKVGTYQDPWASQHSIITQTFMENYGVSEIHTDRLPMPQT